MRGFGVFFPNGEGMAFDTYIMKRISEAFQRNGLPPIKRGDPGTFHRILGLIEKLEKEAGDKHAQPE